MRVSSNLYEQAFNEKKVRILFESHPLTARALSVDNFLIVLSLYLKKHSIDSFDPLALSKHLCDFLRKTDPWKENSLVAEIARFERHILCVQNAILPVEHGKRSINSVRLSFGTEVITSLYALHSILNKKNYNPKSGKPKYYVIHKSKKKIQVTLLNRIEHQLLHWMQPSINISKLIDRASKIKISEKRFYQILFKLKKLGLIEENLSFN